MGSIMTGTMILKLKRVTHCQILEVRSQGCLPAGSTSRTPAHALFLAQGLALLPAHLEGAAPSAQVGRVEVDGRLGGAVDPPGAPVASAGTEESLGWDAPGALSPCSLPASPPIWAAVVGWLWEPKRRGGGGLTTSGSTLQMMGGESSAGRGGPKARGAVGAAREARGHTVARDPRTMAGGACSAPGAPLPRRGRGACRGRGCWRRGHGLRERKLAARRRAPSSPRDRAAGLSGGRRRGGGWRRRCPAGRPTGTCPSGGMRGAHLRGRSGGGHPPVRGSGALTMYCAWAVYLSSVCLLVLGMHSLRIKYFSVRTKTFSGIGTIHFTFSS